MSTEGISITQNQCQQCGLKFHGVGNFCCNSCEVLFGVNHEQFDPQKNNPHFEKSLSDFAYLDEQEFKNFHRLQNTSTEKQSSYLFYAEGLHCSSCVHLLEKLPEFDGDILSARVSFGSSTVLVEIKPQASIARVAALIAELGYKPVLLSSSENLLEQYQKENRSALKRIAVAGFVAGNIMLFVIPIYSGLAGSWAEAFQWVSFFLFIPLVTYSAIPFYQGTINALKYRVMNVDLPITVALLSGFIASTINLFRGNGHIYFDSTASFIFLILISRYLLKKVQQGYLGSTRLRNYLPTSKVILLRNGQSRPIPVSFIKEKDLIEIHANDIIPVDGILRSEFAEIDASILTGESIPQRFVFGMKVFAGTRLLSESAKITTEKVSGETRIGQIIQKLTTESISKTRFVALSDKLAQILLITVFGIAIFWFFAFVGQDFTLAFNRSLALIVVACPCALAFGAPLTYGIALQKARELGILLKNGDALERLLSVKNLFFDKTGTITTGKLSLDFENSTAVSDEVKQIVLSLESKSHHPIAFAFRHAWKDILGTHELLNHQEITGRGVRGSFNGEIYELAPRQIPQQNKVSVELLKNQQPIAFFEFNDQIHSDSAQIISRLKKSGFSVSILSGDHSQAVQDVANLAQIPMTNVFSGLSPEQKLEKIKNSKDSCMIGDGANDAMALKAADVGIAVHGSVDLSLRFSDAYFTKKGLSSLIDLIQLSRKTRKVLHRNLAFALIYNIVAGICALMGWIDPLAAALLMPLSSGAIILSSVWGFR